MLETLDAGKINYGSFAAYGQFSAKGMEKNVRSCPPSLERTTWAKHKIQYLRRSVMLK